MTLVGAFLSGPAWAQDLCEAPGGDLVLSHIEGLANYATVSGTDALVLATRQTNVGSQPLTANLSTAEHPLQVPNLYRHMLVGGVSRFEQIGMGWCFHAGIPLNMGGFCTCQGGSSLTIGPGCSDPHSAGAMGQATNLGPRWEANASTGLAMYPHATPAVPQAGLLRVATSDLDPAGNPGATFIGEVVVIHPGEGVGNTVNNATWRPLSVSFSGGNGNVALAGMTHPGGAAIQSWKTLVPGVSEAVLDVPGDGRYLLAARAIRVGGNQWNYEYAVFNLNSHRAARALVLQRSAGLVVGGHGFHDVAYHSGDGPGGVNIVGTDWAFDGGADELRWETESFEANPAANALRWGTLYNFRVSCNAAPTMGQAVLELFRPGDPATAGAAITVPGGPACLGDHDGDGVRAVSDIFAFLSDWFAHNAAGDADGDGASTVPDIFVFLSSWFAGC